MLKQTKKPLTTHHDLSTWLHLAKVRGARERDQSPLSTNMPNEGKSKSKKEYEQCNVS
jgi:hypothetical protein